MVRYPRRRSSSSRRSAMKPWPKVSLGELRYFQSPSYWAQIADEKEGTGQPNLNGSKLEKLKVPIAPPAEQRRIVSELDALQAEVDALKRLQAKTAAELDALLPAVLDKAFKGELLND